MEFIYFFSLVGITVIFGFFVRFFFSFFFLPAAAVAAERSAVEKCLLGYGVEVLGREV